MAESELARRLLAGDRRALARAITLVQDDDPAGWALVREVYPQTGSATIVGFTGPPGAGKSTLIGALTRRRRALGRQIGVLSIDPSSPFSGGAVLGDRIRLSEHFLDSGVFIRSMATRGALGGLAEAALQTTLLMEAAGREEIYLETVGVGQAEVDVAGHADTVVLVLVPGSGDSVQALKAGVMEIPDVVVVNKSDHPLADVLVRELRGVLSLGPPTRLAGADRQYRRAQRSAASRRSRRHSKRIARMPSPVASAHSDGGATSATRWSSWQSRGCAATSSAASPRTPPSSVCSTRSWRAALDPASAARTLSERPEA